MYAGSQDRLVKDWTSFYLGHSKFTLRNILIGDMGHINDDIDL